MSLTAQSIIKRAGQILQDSTNIRWNADELVRWLNDGQREIVLYRPDSNSKRATNCLLAADTRQDLNSIAAVLAAGTPAKLIDIVRNTIGTKRAVRQVAREILDSQSPGWHGMTPAAEILHFTFDQLDPRAFYVYPPANGTTTSIEIIFSAYPTDVAEPAAGSEYTAVTGNIGISDIYGNALLDYVMYRAYMKDADFAGNPQRAMSHYSAMATSLGVELKGTMMASPNSGAAVNPNMPKSGPIA